MRCKIRSGYGGLESQTGLLFSLRERVTFWHLKTRLQLSTAGFTYMALVFKDKAAQHPLPSFTYRPPLLWEARCLFALTAVSEME